MWDRMAWFHSLIVSKKMETYASKKTCSKGKSTLALWLLCVSTSVKLPLPPVAQILKKVKSWSTTWHWKQQDKGTLGTPVKNDKVTWKITVSAIKLMQIKLGRRAPTPCLESAQSQGRPMLASSNSSTATLCSDQPWLHRWLHFMIVQHVLICAV